MLNSYMKTFARRIRTSKKPKKKQQSEHISLSVNVCPNRREQFPSNVILWDALTSAVGHIIAQYPVSVPLPSHYINACHTLFMSGWIVCTHWSVRGTYDSSVYCSPDIYFFI